MSEYTLYYFPLRGKAELARYIFHQSGNKFNDNKISREQWPGLKSKMPMGQMPVLQLNDERTICQSMAIARFLANEFGLAGKDNFEKALADMYVDGVQDLYPGFRPVVMEYIHGDVDKAKENFKKFNEEYYQPFLERYENFLAQSESGWLVGASLTWADLCLAEMVDRILLHDENSLSKTPKLKGLWERVHTDPKIKAYIEERPKYMI